MFLHLPLPDYYRARRKKSCCHGAFKMASALIMIFHNRQPRRLSENLFKLKSRIVFELFKVRLFSMKEIFFARLSATAFSFGLDIGTATQAA